MPEDLDVDIHSSILAGAVKGLTKSLDVDVMR